MRRQRAFTVVELVIVLAVIGILVAILTPVISKHIKDAKTTRACNEVIVISTAILSLHKDTGMWPCTNADGPSGGVDRVITAPDAVPAGVESGAAPGAINWGTLGSAKPLYDYLFYNNPDNDSGPVNQNQPGQDYPISGKYAWRGPYLDQEIITDPWGQSYVINARYFPGNPRSGSLALNHRVWVLSAGANGLWATAFDDNINRLTTPDDAPKGDDIGCVITTNSRY